VHVWMIGSGTQFNINANEVVSNRWCQLAGTPLDGNYPVYPNDHVNISQLSNDTLASAMHTAAAVNVKERLIPAVAALRDTIAIKAGEWEDIVKIDRTHMPDATPLTLGQEWSGYAAMLSDNLELIERDLPDLYKLALGGTAVKTGINSMPGFAKGATAKIARLTDLAFVSAPNKFAVQGAHCAHVQLFAMMANDVAVGFGGAEGYLEMNVYKPVMIANIARSITLLSDGCTNFRRVLVEGTQPNRKKISECRWRMLITAPASVIGYDEASAIAHFATENDLTLREAAQQLGHVDEATFDRVVDSAKMIRPYVANKADHGVRTADTVEISQMEQIR
jgi:fumarate hydratase, class II